MRVASEQASGEKYRSMDDSLAVRSRLFETWVDFYTVPHNINCVKEFIAKWYKKVKRRRRSPMLSRQSAAAGRGPINLKSHSARRSICFAKTASLPPRSTTS